MQTPIFGFKELPNCLDDNNEPWIVQGRDRRARKARVGTRALRDPCLDTGQPTTELTLVVSGAVRMWNARRRTGALAQGAVDRSLVRGLASVAVHLAGITAVDLNTAGGTSRGRLAWGTLAGCGRGKAGSS
jgi:hypothetical protein